MKIYTTTKAGYDKLKQALELASEDKNSEIFVCDTFIEGAAGVSFPVYHVENATVKILPRNEAIRVGISAKSEFFEREAVSALEHLAVEQGLTDRKIKLTKQKSGDKI